MKARCVIYCKPKICNLSLLVFLSNDFLLFETGHRASFLLEFVEKHVAVGFFACCTTKNYVLVVPQKLRSSQKMSSMSMLRKTHLNVLKIIIFAKSSLDSFSSLSPLQ